MNTWNTTTSKSWMWVAPDVANKMIWDIGPSFLLPNHTVGTLQVCQITSLWAKLKVTRLDNSNIVPTLWFQIYQLEKRICPTLLICRNHRICELISNDNEAFFPGRGGKCEEQETRWLALIVKILKGNTRTSQATGPRQRCVWLWEAWCKSTGPSPSTLTASWSVTESRVTGPVMGPF